MEFASDVSKEDMKGLVEDSFSSKVWNAVSRLGCDIDVQISDDFVPTLTFTAPSNLGINVTFETREIIEDDVVVGYDFVPTIETNSIIEKDCVDAMRMFKDCAEIAQIAEDIFEVDILPYEYFD